ncbi:carbohydrate ABC transporter permease [Paenibacillus radicis (ex Xue et al. 2023)]|uniref:Carbohydrate ABC transporter permease n=1 Tax=Paenibacillus radicis (ex Xue et al. 2023) TaxID=2972489 RepID=A0ABT1YIN3_9BACL|nr:carbohydrate ABC transporter permease [Paenibacillus radicis (ex Xue et al. 2023)]MCR8633037.1 carbohydrate ABC transporter permease [Paenibacillus radicis (ex Xue et al. 2023)]
MRVRFLQHGLVYISALILCSFCLIPILWGISTSLKPDNMVYAQPPQWIPDPIDFSQYASILKNKMMMRYFLNSSIIAIGSTVFSLVIGIMAAYGFSRFKFPGRNTLLWSILFTQIFPRVVIIIPFYVTLRNLNLLGTYTGLILVYLIVVLPISVWLLKGFIDKIPYEMEEAAVIDGCSIFALLWRIVIPMTFPAIAAVAMYSFILAWNEFLFALIFSSAETRPVSVGLAFFIDEQGVRWGQLMAASILMSIPAIIIFSLAQKLLVRGLSEGAVKG